MKNKASLIPFVILGVVTILGCGRFSGRVSNDAPKTRDEVSSTAFSLDGKEWKTHELDDMDIAVDLPGEPSDKTPPQSRFPAGSQQIFSSIRIHAFDEKDFGSSYTQLVLTGKRKFTIKELADTSMTAVRKQRGDLSYTLDIKSPTNAKINGTFTHNGKNFELRGCTIYQKDPSRVWEVLTLYPKENADGRTAGTRIIESAAFKGSSEECE
jgi:hypothetical protein